MSTTRAAFAVASVASSTQNSPLASMEIIKYRLVVIRLKIVFMCNNSIRQQDNLLVNGILFQVDMLSIVLMLKRHIYIKLKGNTI